MHLTDVTLAVKGASSKLVGVVPFADVDIEKSVDNRLVTVDKLAKACQARQ